MGEGFFATGEFTNENVVEVEKFKEAIGLQYVVWSNIHTVCVGYRSQDMEERAFVLADKFGMKHVW